MPSIPVTLQLQWHVSSSHCLKITQNVAFEFWHFPPIFVLLKLTYLATLFDRKLQVLKNSLEWTIFGIFKLTFVHSKCKRSSLRSQFWMRLFFVIFKHCPVVWFSLRSAFNVDCSHGCKDDENFSSHFFFESSHASLLATSLKKGKKSSWMASLLATHHCWAAVARQ